MTRQFAGSVQNAPSVSESPVSSRFSFAHSSEYLTASTRSIWPVSSTQHRQQKSKPFTAWSEDNRTPGSRAHRQLGQRRPVGLGRRAVLALGLLTLRLLLLLALVAVHSRPAPHAMARTHHTPTHSERGTGTALQSTDACSPWPQPKGITHMYDFFCSAEDREERRTGSAMTRFLTVLTLTGSLSSLSSSSSSSSELPLRPRLPARPILRGEREGGGSNKPWSQNQQREQDRPWAVQCACFWR
jgi:hypothetical protein